MIYWEIFLAFFVPGVVGYGGGPSSIPLIQTEVVDRYGWLTNAEFGEILAFGNALPGPIATKIAGHIGYQVGGVFGSAVALFATVAPSLIAMVLLLGLLLKHKDSPKVKRMTAFIRPTIAILLVVLAYEFIETSWFDTGWFQTILLAILGFVLLERLKIHPALVIVGYLIYGGIFLG
ncbi:chromate transporter [Gracilibacillus sp. S3-1-1]|uniref:Chromate transporter n=1 Tax=Gracilibacillus pellucidus TaxID=3095368 RepID=A0ACC6M3Q2_9BACI|nr:chromate transporter [Gracilibacillus sp. S3-1-1]MDX8045562.1 chromate transporter [Gracilibacillus sp. S3-1-1]